MSNDALNTIVGNLVINSYTLFEDMSNSILEEGVDVSKISMINIDITNVYNLIVSDIFNITSGVNATSVSTMAIDFIENLVYREYDIVLNGITTSIVNDDEDICQNILNVYGVDYNLMSKIETELLINLLNDRYLELKILLNRIYKRVPNHELFYAIPVKTKNISYRIITYIYLLYGDIDE